jgi:hypothetical protein
MGLFDSLGEKFKASMKAATSDACCEEDKGA